MAATRAGSRVTEPALGDGRKPGLVGALTRHNHPNRAPQNGDIQQRRVILNVVEVVLDVVLERPVASPLNLLNFVKITSLIALEERSALALSKPAQILASAESLGAHAAAARLREEMQP